MDLKFLAFRLLLVFILIQASTFGSKCLGKAGFAPANDHCHQAFRIKNVQNWCSAPRQFTNEAAGPSQVTGPLCFSGYDPSNDRDVWFVFTARATTVNISVIGAVANNPKGTLRNPQFALYIGSCKQVLQEVACISDFRGNNITETFVRNLVVGADYYLRVDGRFGNTGSFQLCVNNYNPVPSSSSDCTTAVVLCDKSSFTVPSIVGVGRNTAEITGGLCLKEESSSAWYKWTCDKAGTLTFTLQPVNPGDDLDFALFLLPNGVDDCDIKVPLRCMASGENVDQPAALWSGCSGATGLRLSSIDLLENEGCDQGNDNFLAALQMEAGKSYALLVNNYHNTGNGFSIEFGGTGTLKGPNAHFTVNKLSLTQDQDLYVKDASTFTSKISKWEWNFGLNAVPQTATGKGLHKVNYATPGRKSISLSIETSNGCKVTKVRTVQIKEVSKVSEPPKPEPIVLESGFDLVIDTSGVEHKVVIENQKKQNGSSESEITEAGAGEAESSLVDTITVAETSSNVVELTVKYVATIYFKADSSALVAKDKETLIEVLQIMAKYPDHLAIVEGYTNSIPSDDYCYKLAEARADSVIKYLRDSGIEEERIVKRVHGRKKSLAGPNSFIYRKLYQKVELRIAERE